MVAQIYKKLLIGQLSRLSLINGSFAEIEVLLEKQSEVEEILTASIVANSGFELKLTKSGDLVVIHLNKVIAMHSFEENIETLCVTINSIFKKYLFALDEIKDTENQYAEVELWHGVSKRSVLGLSTVFLLSFDATEEEIMDLLNKD